MAGNDPPQPQSPEEPSGEDAARTKEAKDTVEAHIRSLRKIIRTFRKLFN